MNIIKTSCPMRSKPNDESELETECLYGEFIEILNENLEWLYCKLLTDGYCGWIRKGNVGTLKKPTHRVISKRSFMFKDKNVKSGCIGYLPLGSSFAVEKCEDNWAKLSLKYNFSQKVAYVPKNHLISINDKIFDWVSIAESLVGTPYVWGGRNTIGLDCSALLQLTYQTFGQNIPRNTKDQMSINKKIINDLNALDRGFVVFWSGHVGIMVDKFNCIHANAHHMQVVIEPLFKIVARMGKTNPITKIMNFN